MFPKISNRGLQYGAGEINAYKKTRGQFDLHNKQQNTSKCVDLFNKNNQIYCNA